jgi:hypothetical protein
MARRYGCKCPACQKAYSEKQKENYLAPEVIIEFTDQDDTVEVHMSVLYLDVKYAFNSVKVSDADRIYDELSSVSVVTNSLTLRGAKI